MDVPNLLAYSFVGSRGPIIGGSSAIVKRQAS